METLWTLLKSLAPVLYGGIGLLLLITLGQAWRAYRRLVRAFFRVEREIAAMDLFSGLARAAFLLALGLGLWLLVGPGVLSPSSVSPALPTPVPVPSPTVPGLRRPTPTVSPSLAFPHIPSPSPFLSLSPVPSPSPTSTWTPTPPQARCPDPNAQIDFPPPGQVISQPITLIGTATHPAFQFYKVEIHGPYTGGQWVTLGDVVWQPVIRGPLWTFDPRPFFPQPGHYQLRVVVVDITAREVGICEVPVVIASPGGNSAMDTAGVLLLSLRLKGKEKGGQDLGLALPLKRRS